MVSPRAFVDAVRAAVAVRSLTALGAVAFVCLTAIVSITLLAPIHQAGKYALVGVELALFIGIFGYVAYSGRGLHPSTGQEYLRDLLEAGAVFGHQQNLRPLRNILELPASENPEGPTALPPPTPESEEEPGPK